MGEFLFGIVEPSFFEEFRVCTPEGGDVLLKVKALA
jgi:hypothetical protein